MTALSGSQSKPPALPEVGDFETLLITTIILKVKILNIQDITIFLQAKILCH